MKTGKIYFDENGDYLGSSALCVMLSVVADDEGHGSVAAPNRLCHTICRLIILKGCNDVTMAETNSLRHQSAGSHVRCKMFDALTVMATEAAFDLVIDAVGAGAMRKTAFQAVKPCAVIMHIGLQDCASETDMRKLTQAEITLLGACTYTTAGLRATVKALYRGAFGNLEWIETRPMSKHAQTFDDLDKGQTASAKVVMLPHL